MSGMGFQPREAEACSHAGLWDVATVAGFGVLFCEGCGKSFFLKQVEGELFWQEADRFTADELIEAARAVEEGGDDGVAEAVRELPDGEARAERLLQEPQQPGRAGPPLPGVSPGVERPPTALPEGPGAAAAGAAGGVRA